MLSLRAVHSYLSIFVAPTILFFALTGTLQLFNLHESHGNYHAPVVMQKLARLHKDQIFALEENHGPADAAPSQSKDLAAPPPPEDDDRTPPATLLLKWFFLLAAAALVSSTCLGLWIGLTHIRRRRLGWLLLVLGAAIPAVLAAV